MTRKFFHKFRGVLCLGGVGSGHSASWVSQRVRITFIHFRCTVTTTEVGLHYLLHHLPMTWCHPRATLPSSQVASSLPSLRCIIPLAWMGTRWPVWTPATNHEAIMNLSHYCDISTFSFLIFENHNVWKLLKKRSSFLVKIGAFLAVFKQCGEVAWTCKISRFLLLNFFYFFILLHTSAKYTADRRLHKSGLSVENCRVFSSIELSTRCLVLKNFSVLLGWQYSHHHHESFIGGLEGWFYLIRARHMGPLVAEAK